MPRSARPSLLRLSSHCRYSCWSRALSRRSPPWPKSRAPIRARRRRLRLSRARSRLRNPRRSQLRNRHWSRRPKGRRLRQPPSPRPRPRPKRRRRDACPHPRPDSRAHASGACRCADHRQRPRRLPAGWPCHADRLELAARRSRPHLRERRLGQLLEPPRRRRRRRERQHHRPVQPPELVRRAVRRRRDRALSGIATTSFTDGAVRARARTGATNLVATFAANSFVVFTNITCTIPSSGSFPPAAFSTSASGNGYAADVPGCPSQADRLRLLRRRQLRSARPRFRSQAGPRTRPRTRRFSRPPGHRIFRALTSGQISLTANYSSNLAPVVTAPANQNANEGNSTSFNLGSLPTPRPTRHGRSPLTGVTDPPIRPSTQRLQVRWGLRATRTRTARRPKRSR